jgi:hypothetical protein
MSDVVTFTVVIAGRYPSVNHTHADGFRGGKKSPEYLDLKLAVRAAAQAEMKCVGWTQPASWYVAIDLTRVVPDRRRRDPMNMGKAELDALRPAEPRDPDFDPADPFPGLYVDDDLALVVPRIELEVGGIDRLIITARRCYPPLHEPPAAIAKRASRRTAVPKIGAKTARSPAPHEGRKRSAFPGDIPPGHALCNGELIPIEEALRQVRRRHIGRRR